MSDAYTRFCASALFPLHERLKGHDSVAVRRRLEETQWWQPARLRELQVGRLRAFLEAIGENVPYYGRLFAAHGFRAAAVDSLDALARLPLLAKADIRAHGEELKARGASRLARRATGGSSGEPLVFQVGRERISHDVGARWRAMRWFGVDIGDPEVVVWGSPIELGAQDALRAIRDRLLRTRLLPAFEMSPATLERMVAAIRAARPRMLFGYPSALGRIALHAERGGVRLDDLGVRVAFVTAEVLHDAQRRALEAAFGCAVANGYGGRDAGFVAHECPRGGMHVCAEDVVVEIVSPQGEALPVGASGEIVVTHLATRDFPFVRYRTGDLGVLSEASCPCGRGLPLLEEIRGRATDFLVARDGTVVHALAAIYVLRELPGIAAFQIVQESLDRTVVKVVPGPGYGPECERRIVAGIRARLGEATDVAVERVGEIAPEATGKFRHVQSRVAV